jgi:hypothetical protein|tara:strand:+ start:414 stop:665 length:252 start_codon:yes stop_codon:yes gene_type:complete
MTITVDYPMLEQLRKNIEYSDMIKNRLFKEFITWHFSSMFDDDLLRLDDEQKRKIFVRKKNDLDNDFEAIVNQFLKENHIEEE